MDIPKALAHCTTMKPEQTEKKKTQKRPKDKTAFMKYHHKLQGPQIQRSINYNMAGNSVRERSRLHRLAKFKIIHLPNCPQHILPTHDQKKTHAWHN